MVVTILVQIEPISEFGLWFPRECLSRSYGYRFGATRTHRERGSLVPGVVGNRKLASLTRQRGWDWNIPEWCSVTQILFYWLCIMLPICVTGLLGNDTGPKTVHTGHNNYHACHGEKKELGHGAMGLSMEIASLRKSKLLSI